jgi:hypothetical protein
VTVAQHLDDLEAYLTNGASLYAFAPQVHGGGGHGGKFAIVLDGGVAVFCKPASGVNDGGRAARNEVAAWIVARLLGWTDLMAATILRSMPNPTTASNEDMALQVLWPGSDFTPDPSGFTDDELWKAALFDHIVWHSDRMNNNWLGVPPAALPFPGPVPGHQQQLKLIDHGYAFNYPGRDHLSSSFVERKRGLQVPLPYLTAMQTLQALARSSDLSTLLDPGELGSLVARIDEIVSRGSIP